MIRAPAKVIDHPNAGKQMEKIMENESETETFIGTYELYSKLLVSLLNNPYSSPLCNPSF